MAMVVLCRHCCCCALRVGLRCNLYGGLDTHTGRGVCADGSSAVQSTTIFPAPERRVTPKTRGGRKEFVQRTHHPPGFPPNKAPSGGSVYETCLRDLPMCIQLSTLINTSAFSCMGGMQ
jgi:hypothetical protein